MSKDTILIFDTETSFDNIEISNKTEKELFYDNLKKNKKFNPIMVDSYKEMEEFIENQELNESTIDSIILEQLYPFIIPIIGVITPLDINISKSNEPVKFKNYDNKKYIELSIKTMSDITCILKNNNDFDVIGISKNTDIKIIGFAIHKQLRVLLKENKHIKDYINDIDYSSLYLSGIYSLFNFLSNIYFHHKFKSIRPSIKLDNGDSIFQDLTYFVFTNEKDTHEQLEITKKNIIYINEYYNTHEYNLYKNIQHNKINLNLIKYMEHKIKITDELVIETQSKILDKIGKYLKQDLLFNTQDKTNINLFNNKLYDKYKKLELLNEDNIISKNIINELNNLLNLQLSKNRQIYNKFKKQLELYYKKNLSLKKFNIADLNKLKKEQNEIINKEYDLYISRHERPQEYKDILILYQYFNENNIDGIKLQLKKLEKELSIGKTLGKEYIKNKDKINIICPHNIDKARIIIDYEHKNIIDINQAVINNLINNYGVDMMEGTIYCKICGEELYEKQEEDIVITSQSEYTKNNDYDVLYLLINREVIYIISNFLEFSNNSVKNLSEIIKNITISIKPEIYSIQSSLFKIKTLNKENINILLNIYINIYVFASLVQLIFTNYSEMSFKPVSGLFLRSAKKVSKVGGKLEVKSKIKLNKTEVKSKIKSKIKLNKTEVSPIVVENTKISSDSDINIALKKRIKNTEKNKNLLQYIINDALNIIKKIKYFEIQKIDSISIDSIKPLFLKAYKWVLNINYIPLKFIEYRYFLQNNVINYFIYGYNQYLYSLKNHNKPLLKIQYNDIHLNKNIKVLKSEIKLILGRSYETIDSQNISPNDISIYNTLVKPLGWKNKYNSDSLLYLYNYIINDIFLEHVSDNNTILIEFYDNYKYLFAIEKQNSIDFKLKNLKPFDSFYYNPTKIYIKDIDNIHKCCKKNRKYYFKKIDKKGNFIGEKKEILLDSINEWLKEKNVEKLKDYFTYYLYEIECSCKYKKNDNDYLISSFYDYFNTKCPKDGIHEFNDKVICIKCGFSKEIMENMDKKYFDKYLPRYKLLKKEEKNIIENQFIDFNKQKTSMKNIIKDKTKINKWKYTNDNIIKLSKQFNIKYNELISLGLFENNELSDIINGKNKDLIDISDLKIKKRNNNLYDYYLYIIRKYYLLKNSEFLSDFPPFINDFLKKYSNKDFFKKMPNINDNFLNMYEIYLKNETEISNISNFLLDGICKTLLKIFEILTKIKDEEMAKKFVESLISVILSFEKNLTKFEVKKYRFSSSEDSDIQTLDIKETDLEDYDEHTFEAEDIDMNIDFDEPETIEDYEQEDIFSLADIDIEMDEEENLNANPADF
jgi:hypothetical protein